MSATQVQILLLQTRYNKITPIGHINLSEYFFVRGEEMTVGFPLFRMGVLLGLGLAMDAFSVSMADGLSEPEMKKKKGLLIALVFGMFQGFMPFAGWFFVHSFVQYFNAFQRFIPYIALILLVFIGGKMLLDSRKNEEVEVKRLTFSVLFVQGIATSIDALSVGFTISDYDLKCALTASTIISAVTVVTCFIGVEIGKRFGVRLSDKAQLFGGVILILIGLEIFLSGVGVI